MSSATSSDGLVCPICKRTFPSDFGGPDTASRCPYDRANLVRPASNDPRQTLQPTHDFEATMRITEPGTPVSPSGQDTVVNTQHEETPVLGSGRSADRTIMLNIEASQALEIESDNSPVARTITQQGRSVLAMLDSFENRMDHGETASKDKYEFISELGKGGVGQVLKVLDRDLKREVAMKMLLPASPGAETNQTQDALLRFIEEAQATGQLEHPNIVPVHDLGVNSEGRIYFTLKYVEGHSLKKVIRGRIENSVSEDGLTRFRHDYSPLRMIQVLISVCQAVAYAHSKGIIHRDLKPDNIMLGKYGEVLVMDWGLAKVVGSDSVHRTASDATVQISTSRAEDLSQATMEGSIAGTPAYMSPEQAQGKISELDQRTDIYALGAILYEILSGEPPYRGANAFALVAQVAQGPPPPIRKQKGAFGFSSIPRELAAICERAMARNPRDRYQTTGALRDDLQAYLENLPVSAAPDTYLQQVGKWLKRNKAQVQSATLSAAVVLLIVFGAWFGWRAWRLNDLLGEGENLLKIARNEYNASSASVKVSAADPYAAQMQHSLRSQRAGNFRKGIQQALEPLRRAIDLSPENFRARSLMAEANMDLWRLAVLEQNRELADVTRREVESLAPDPSVFAAELDGLGSVEATFDAPDAEAFLFRFETLNVLDKGGVPQPPRLIPVPYDLRQRRVENQFLYQEQMRISAGKPLPVDKHSIFNLEPTPASFAGSGGKVTIPALPPGNYMLLVRAPGRIEGRVSLRVDRLGSVKQQYVLPKTEDNPPGFFYMAGGDIFVGGETAGAATPHSMKVEQAWIYHDEISMGEYGAFLQSLFTEGKVVEARQRLPRDFGKTMAILDNRGALLPADPSVDPAAFAKTPVRGVSFNDAQAYVTWRGRKEGFPYRLPKDWEWEAACRGADGRKYSWGEMPGKDLAVVTQGYGDSGGDMSWKWEDYKDESPWGIHNLAGGAAEWTMSSFDPDAKPADPVFGQFAIRGNAWALPPVGLECAFRTSGQPDYFHPTIGFRMALDHPYTRTAAPEEPAAAHDDAH